MIDILTYLIVLFAVMQPSKKRLYPALVFGIATLSFNVFARNIGDVECYVYAVLVDALIMTLIVKSDSRLTGHIIEISVTSAVINTIGLILYAFYFPPIIYDTALICLYLYAITKLLYGGEDGRHIEDNSWNIGLFGYAFKDYWNIHRVGKQK